MLKKWKAVFAIVCIAALLCGCGSTPSSTPSSKVEASSAVKSSTPESEPVSSGTALASPSWKTDTSPITLEWFIGYDWASFNFDPTNNEFDKWCLDETGVTISYSFGNQEKLNVLINTDSLPDIVTYDVISTERLSMENGGLLLPLDDLREQYAPDFRVVPAMMDWYRNENDGHWYSYASYFYDVEDTESRGGYLTSHNMNFARKDIMEQLGIKPEDMQTKEGMIAALKKVKDADITYNGVKVEPIHGAGGNTTQFYAEQFGLDREDKDGNFLNMYRQPEYLEALLFQNQLYREGLISDEEFTADNVLRKQKVTSGAYFAGTGQADLDGKADLFYSDNEALMMYVGHIKGDSGKDPIITPSTTGGWTGTEISKNCKDPARAIQLFAFLSQPENGVSYYLGGVNCYDLVNGKAVIKPECAQEREADAVAYNNRTRSGIQEYLLDFVDVQIAQPEDNMDALQQDEANGRVKYMDGHYYDDKIFSNVIPEGGSDLAAISAQIEDYWSQQAAQIIMAPSAEEAEKLYNDAIAQMDQMGMKELDEYRNERFQKNKEKMGVKFAWPRNQ